MVAAYQCDQDVCCGEAVTVEEISRGDRIVTFTFYIVITRPERVTNEF
jgi:hypothetical protein